MKVEKKHRISKACDSCNKKRKKCDGLNPCQGCVNRKIECIYSMPTKKRGPPRQTDKPLKGDVTDISSVTTDNDLNLRKLGSNPKAFQEQISPIPLIPDISIGQNNSPRSHIPLRPTVFKQLQGYQFPDTGNVSFVKLHPSVDNLVYTTEAVENHKYFFQAWTWKSLGNITLKDLTVVTWQDLYFQDFSPRFPIFAKSWILENYKNLPIFLLQVLYLHTLSGENVLATNEIVNLKSNLFAYLNLKCEYALDDQGPFTAIGSFLLGRYAYDLGGFGDFARACLMVCAKIKQQLGIGFGTSVQWKSQNNIIYQMDTQNLKLTWSIFRYIFCEYCYTFGHILDPPFYHDIHVIDMFEGGDSSYYTYHFVQKWKHHNELLFISKKVSLYANQCRNVNSETTKILLNELEAWFHDLPSESACFEVVPSQRAALHNLILYHNMKLLLLWANFVDSNEFESICKTFENSLNVSFESIRVLISLAIEKEWCPSSFYFCVFITGAALCLQSAKGKGTDLKKRSYYLLEILEKCGYFPSRKSLHLRAWIDDPAKLLKHQSFWELNEVAMKK